MYAVIETGGKQYRVEAGRPARRRAARGRRGHAPARPAGRRRRRARHGLAARGRVRDRPGRRRGQGPEDQRLHVQEQEQPAQAAGATARSTPRSRSPGSRRAREAPPCRRRRVPRPRATVVTPTRSGSGVKRFSGQDVSSRARSSSASAARSSTPASTSGAGSDDTLFATADGVVKFGTRRGRKLVDIVPAGTAGGVTAGGAGTLPPPAALTLSAMDFDLPAGLDRLAEEAAAVASEWSARAAFPDDTWIVGYDASFAAELARARLDRHDLAGRRRRARTLRARTLRRVRTAHRRAVRPSRRCGSRTGRSVRRCCSSAHRSSVGAGCPGSSTAPRCGASACRSPTTVRMSRGCARRGPGRRRLDRHRAEGVDLGCRRGGLDLPDRPHRSRCAAPCRVVRSRRRPASAGHRDPARSST